jgi:hypothetical protein
MKCTIWKAGQGYAFIFEKGGYDGFSLDEIEVFLQVTGERSEMLAGYEFKDVGRFSAEHAAGVFQSTFAFVSRFVAASSIGPTSPRCDLNYHGSN